ncbi:MAG TPA: Fe-S cluster assembly protein SufD [Stellaceae bacterium]|nr:Fe-S cluster assembly protein SufD [Stellaceae bacterium]
MSDLTSYTGAFRADPGEPAWLVERRQSALARFGELGLPTRRQENWRFTNLRALETTDYPPASGVATVAEAALAPYLLTGASHRIVLVNGRFSPTLSAIGPLPAGTYLAPLSTVLRERADLAAALFDGSDAVANQPFAALNAAFAGDGFVLALEDGVALGTPIEIVHLASAAAPHAAHTRNAILAGKHSRARIVESHAGSGRYWRNLVTRVALGEGAMLRHVTLQDDGDEAINTGISRVVLATGARYDAFTLTVGALLSRADMIVAITGERVHCGVSGAYLLRGRQEATIATLIDHAAPGSETREVFKGVVEDRAHGVFQGKIQVRREAQQTNAHQLNKNLLLSPRAAIDSKPELEIFADDVKCSHGATIGDLDETAMFYLRARGIPESEARLMLIEAFAAEAIELVEDAAAQTYLRRHLDTWLANPKG